MTPETSAMTPETSAITQETSAWLGVKLRNYYPAAQPETVRALRMAAAGDMPAASAESAPPFDNPFTITDLLVFDEETLRDALVHGAHGLPLDELAVALHDAPTATVEHVLRALSEGQQAHFRDRLNAPVAPQRVAEARRHTLDALFWELTYWKTPDLYDQLTEGEALHSGIFAQLASVLHGSDVVDVGAGSGRATFACLQDGARHVYAVEPSPGLLRLLRRKMAGQAEAARITPLRGRFDALPLADDSVDVALSCSAFIAEPEQGGEPGLAEMLRVTRAGGRIVIIWPRPEDYAWLAAHGFRYVALPVPPEMVVRYRSWEVAQRVAQRFYARNTALQRYLSANRRANTDEPFGVPNEILSYNPPHDFCWLCVER